MSLNLLNIDKVFSEPTSESCLEGECSPFLPIPHPFSSNVISFTDFLLPGKSLHAKAALAEENVNSDGKNFLDYIKESQSTSQSTKHQSSVNSQDFKVSTNSQMDMQEQSLMEFV